jgi:hypothetical protein
MRVFGVAVDRRRNAAERKLRRDQRVVESNEYDGLLCGGGDWRSGGLTVCFFLFLRFFLHSDATGLVMHKDSAWQSQWSNFKDNNNVVKGLFNLRLKYEESENVLVRGFRALTDTVHEKVGDVFEEGEMAHTLAEISRADPTFNKEVFLHHCETTVIPSVLEVRFGVGSFFSSLFL